MKKIIVVSLCFLAFSACVDLDEDPIDLLDPESFFQSHGDVETAVLGAYGLIASEKLYGRQLVLALQLRSDMCDIGDTGTAARRVQVNNFTMDANNGMAAAIWQQAYKVIAAANLAIWGGEKLKNKENQDTTLLNPLIAEARFVRAFMYYHLVRLFGAIPYIDYYVDDPQSEKVLGLKETPPAEVFDSIISDLNFSKKYLPNSHPNGTRARAAKGTAVAYLAAVHLTLASEYYSSLQVDGGDHYQKAYDEAKGVIDSMGYGLMENFQDLFDATNADGLEEHILIFDFLANETGFDDQNNDRMAPVTGIKGSDKNGWSISVPALKVYNTWDSRDARRKVSFTDSALHKEVKLPFDSFTIPRPHIAKFSNFGGGSGEGSFSDNNYVGMRYAEVLLIAAEACNELGNSGCPEGPNIYINRVRNRARMSNPNGFPQDVTVSDPDLLRDTIMEERRLELAFEFKRWYDIQRREMGEKSFTDSSSSLELQVDFKKRDYLFPKPADELAKNLNLHQNPGY